MQKTTEDQARNHNFRRHARNYGADWIEREDISYDECLDRLTDIYRDLAVLITDETGAESFLDMECFEVPNIRTWFRDFCQPQAEGSRQAVHACSLDRVIVFTSILRAADPEGTAHWDDVQDQYTN